LALHACLCGVSAAGFGLAKRCAETKFYRWLNHWQRAKCGL
jgi:hypothetical protein